MERCWVERSLEVTWVFEQTSIFINFQYDFNMVSSSQDSDLEDLDSLFSSLQTMRVHEKQEQEEEERCGTIARRRGNRLKE